MAFDVGCSLPFTSIRSSDADPRLPASRLSHRIVFASSEPFLLPGRQHHDRLWRRPLRFRLDMASSRYNQQAVPLSGTSQHDDEIIPQLRLVKRSGWIDLRRSTSRPRASSQGLSSPDRSVQETVNDGVDGIPGRSPPPGKPLRARSQSTLIMPHCSLIIVLMSTRVVAQRWNRRPRAMNDFRRDHRPVSFIAGHGRSKSPELECNVLRRYRASSRPRRWR